MQLTRSIIFFNFLLSLMGCSGGTDSQSHKIAYFDLDGFIKSEISRLDSLDLKVKKKVTMNGKVQEKQFNIKNWKRELAVFREADINKPAMYGKYEVDTISSDGGMRIHYTALNKSLKTRDMTVYFKDAEQTPSKITVVVASRNLLYRFNQTLAYSDSGYDISGKQVIRFLGENTFSVETRF